MEPVVVLGCGMSGATVAQTLTSLGLPVVIFEAGRDCGRNHIAKSIDSKCLVEPLTDPCFRPFQANKTSGHYGEDAGTRVRVGGRSLYWRGITLRLEDFALADWPAHVVKALLDSEYPEIERALATWKGSPMDQVRNATENNLLDLLSNNGYVSARPTPRAVRASDDGTWEAFSPVSLLKSIQIHTGHSLEAVKRDGQLLHLTLRAGVREVVQIASAVVLCAGTVENARLTSKITGYSGRFPITDHHAQGWLCAGPSFFSSMKDDEASLLVQRHSKQRFNHFFEVHKVGGTMVADSWTMGEQLAEPTSYLAFEGSTLAAHIYAAYSRSDQIMLQSQAEQLNSLLAMLGLLSRCDLTIAYTYHDAMQRAIESPGQAFRYSCPLGSLDHESSSLQLGGQLVTTSGELRAGKGVYIGGPSLFPRAGAANPSLTTLALSSYIARCIASAIG